MSAAALFELQDDVDPDEDDDFEDEEDEPDEEDDLDDEEDVETWQVAPAPQAPARFLTSRYKLPRLARISSSTKLER